MIKVGHNPKNLRQAYHKDIGKYGKTHIKMRFREREKKDPIFARAAQLRRGIGQRRRQELECDPKLTTTYFYKLLLNQKKCECCQIEFDFSFKHDGIKSNYSPTVDRIDNKLGYTIKNIAVICWRCNNLKRDANWMELQCIVNWMRKKGL